MIRESYEANIQRNIEPGGFGRARKREADRSVGLNMRYPAYYYGTVRGQTAGSRQEATPEKARPEKAKQEERIERAVLAI